MFDSEVVFHFTVKKKGIKPKVSPEIATRVRELLTSSTTATLGTTKQALEAEDVVLGRSTIHRIANAEHLSNQKITLKPDVVFTERIGQLRFDYADKVDGLLDVELWFLDETCFNLHVAQLRCWSEGATPPLKQSRKAKDGTCRC